jgi:hypothetical protein
MQISGVYPLEYKYHEEGEYETAEYVARVVEAQIYA